jgi:hypothetical protein
MNLLKMALSRLNFFQSAENDADIFTKNVNQELCKRHTKQFSGDTGDFSIGCLFQDRKVVGNIPHNQPFRIYLCINLELSDKSFLFLSSSLFISPLDYFNTYQLYSHSLMSKLMK